jgi:choline transport protein
MMEAKQSHTGLDMEKVTTNIEGSSLYPTTTDDARLAQLGHASELKRTFSVWSLACLCLCLMATWEALGSVLSQALLSGGAPCLFYN